MTTGWLTKKAAAITQEQIDSIDWKALESEVSDRIGAPITFTVSISDRGNPKLTSPDIVDKAGVMAAALKSLVVDNFGGGLTADGKDLMIPVHFSYALKDGGTNGMAIVDAFYNFESKQWQFRDR